MKTCSACRQLSLQLRFILNGIITETKTLRQTLVQIDIVETHHLQNQLNVSWRGWQDFADKFFVRNMPLIAHFQQEYKPGPIVGARLIMGSFGGLKRICFNLMRPQMIPYWARAYKALAREILQATQARELFSPLFTLFTSSENRTP